MQQTALIIGRFQPPHLGHLYLCETALSHVDQLIIAIGSANVTDDIVDREKNPWTYDARREMLEAAMREAGIWHQVLAIIPSDDVPDDAEWLGALEEAVHHVDATIDLVVGNNAWVNDTMRQAGYEVLEIPLLQRDIYQGTVIRRQVRTTDAGQYGEPDWHTAVPKSVRKRLQGE